ncbi:teichoic acid transport system permease protein [Flavimobilis soli]|uniref:Teichoic acid transport system permease protein n=1 Tax=Flavimobilis soli TaxID=442709 RepID=A0A2A9EHA4_9MICO|nr:ABC transporter permease [Flavimobilis soli]PFG37610.1 teichoic acid transport system permease protein [Flavimobilis soli]
MTDVVTTGSGEPSDWEDLSPSEAAEKYGLKQMGVRPPLVDYVRSLWARRSFIAVLARARSESENQGTYLGQLWNVLNPVMNATVYVLIFGILLNTQRGMDNVVGFIVVGTFMYRFFSDSVTVSAKSIPKNMSLVRSLHFPRAVLPVSSVLSELATLAPAMGVMAGFVWVSDRFMAHTDGTPSWRWLLIIPATALLYVFSTGAGLVLARWGAGSPDILNTLPFVLRLGMYASGVIFSIDHYVQSEILSAIMSYQPVAVYLNLSRQAMLVETSYPLDGTYWILGAAWALAAFVIGFLHFWRGEARYGRD